MMKNANPRKGAFERTTVNSAPAVPVSNKNDNLSGIRCGIGCLC